MQARQTGDPRRLNAGDAHDRSMNPADIKIVAKTEIVGVEEPPAPVRQVAVAKCLLDSLGHRCRSVPRCSTNTNCEINRYVCRVGHVEVVTGEPDAVEIA